MALHRNVTRVLLACAVSCSTPALARTLEVGPDRPLPLPSAAAAAARDGDVIEIEAGTYVDCAVWRASRLTIVGKGEGAVIATKPCEGKGLFVVRGHDVTIRNLTFTGARVPDANGAGIRAEGRNLTVEGSRFIDNENGILAAGIPGSVIQVRDSRFLRNGSCEKACAHGIYVNRIERLRIERSQFLDTRTAHHVKSRALATELIDNEIMDGTDGTASYLVDIPNGGALTMVGNRLQKGPLSGNPGTAVMIGAEGVDRQGDDRLVIRQNRFDNQARTQTVFVRNLTAAEAVLTGNALTGSVIPLLGRGSVDGRGP